MFKSKYKISMPLSGVAASWLERDGKKFAYLDYDVKKGFKWNMKIYSDEAKSDVLIEVDEQKLSLLAGQSGYVFKDAKTGEELGAWVPKKRFLNIFLRAPYKLMVGGQVAATSPGDGFFKLFMPGSVRTFLFGRKVCSSDGKVVAKIFTQSTMGCGLVKVNPADKEIADGKIATAIAVLAAICGLQD